MPNRLALLVEKEDIPQHLVDVFLPDNLPLVVFSGVGAVIQFLLQLQHFPRGELDLLFMQSQLNAFAGHCLCCLDDLFA